MKPTLLGCFIALAMRAAMQAVELADPPPVKFFWRPSDDGALDNGPESRPCAAGDTIADLITFFMAKHTDLLNKHPDALGKCKVAA